MIEPLTSQEIDALYAYGASLQEGEVRPPEGFEIGGDLQETLEHMMLMKVVIGAKDHNAALAFKQMLLIVHPAMLEAALHFQPTSRVLN